MNSPREAAGDVTGEPPAVWTDWVDEDPLLRRLRLAVRAALDADPVDAWRNLTELGAWEFGLSLADGGLELGHEAVAILCEEVGASLLPMPVMGTLVALDLLAASKEHRELFTAVRSGLVTVAMPGRLPSPVGLPEVFLGEDGEPVPDEELGSRSRALNGTVGPFGAGIAPGAVVVLVERGGRPDVHLLVLPYPGVDVKALPDHGGGPTAAIDLDRARLGDGSLLFSGGRAADVLAAIGPAVAIRQAALLAGLAAAALTGLVDRLHRRHQFGRPLLEHQVPRLRVAALLAQLDVLRLAIRQAARDLDAGRVTTPVAAGVVAMAAETALEISRETLHLHGAAGFARDGVAATCYRRVSWEALRCGPPAALWTQAAGRQRRPVGARR